MGENSQSEKEYIKKIKKWYKSLKEKKKKKNNYRKTKNWKLVEKIKFKKQLSETEKVFPNWRQLLCFTPFCLLYICQQYKLHFLYVFYLFLIDLCCFTEEFFKKYIYFFIFTIFCLFVLVHLCVYMLCIFCVNFAWILL